MTQQPEMRLVVTDAMLDAFETCPGDLGMVCQDYGMQARADLRARLAAALSAAPQPEPVGDLREKVIDDLREVVNVGDYFHSATTKHDESVRAEEFARRSRQITDAASRAIAALSDTAGVGDDEVTSAFVSALAEQQHRNRAGPSAWARLTEDRRRYWIGRVQDEIQIARIAALKSSEPASE